MGYDQTSKHVYNIRYILILNLTTYHCTFPCNKKYAYRFLHETIDACNKMFGIGKLNRVNACYLKYKFEGEQMTHE